MKSIFRLQQVSSRCSAQRTPRPPHPPPPPIRGAFHPNLSLGRTVPECLNRLTGLQSTSPQLAKVRFFSLLLLRLPPLSVLATSSDGKDQGNHSQFLFFFCVTPVQRRYRGQMFLSEKYFVFSLTALRLHWAVQHFDEAKQFHSLA